MSDFKTGGVPNPDYDSDDINYVYQKTEFTDNYFVIPSSKEKNGDSIGLQHCLNALSKKKNSR